MSQRQRMIRQALQAGIDTQGHRPLAFSSSVEGLRWSGLREAIESFALGSGLSVANLSTEPAGFLRHTVRFKLRGDERQVWRFIESLGRSLDQFNEEPARAEPPARKGLLARLWG